MRHFIDVSDIRHSHANSLLPTNSENVHLVLGIVPPGKPLHQRIRRATTQRRLNYSPERNELHRYFRYVELNGSVRRLEASSMHRGSNQTAGLSFARRREDAAQPRAPLPRKRIGRRRARIAEFPWPTAIHPKVIMRKIVVFHQEVSADEKHAVAFVYRANLGYGDAGVRFRVATNVNVTCGVRGLYHGCGAAGVHDVVHDIDIGRTRDSYARCTARGCCILNIEPAGAGSGGSRTVADEFCVRGKCKAVHGHNVRSIHGDCFVVASRPRRYRDILVVRPGIHRAGITIAQSGGAGLDRREIAVPSCLTLNVAACVDVTNNGAISKKSERNQ